MKILAISGSLRAASNNTMLLRAVHAQASLQETLSMMSAFLVADASVTVSILGSSLDEAGIIAHPEISTALRNALLTLKRHTTIV